MKKAKDVIAEVGFRLRGFIAFQWLAFASLFAPEKTVETILGAVKLARWSEKVAGRLRKDASSPQP